MSRLQKKTPSGEKKRKREKQQEGTSPDSVQAKSPAAPAAAKPAFDKKAADTAPGEPNLIQKCVDFYREVMVELKKVTWPTRKQTTGTTVVVIIFVFIVAAFLGLFDLSLSKLVQVVLT